MSKNSSATTVIEEMTYQSLQSKFHGNFGVGIITTTLDLSNVIKEPQGGCIDEDIINMIRQGILSVCTKRDAFSMSDVTIKPQGDLSYYIAIDTSNKTSYSSIDGAPFDERVANMPSGEHAMAG